MESYNIKKMEKSLFLLIYVLVCVGLCDGTLADERPEAYEDVSSPLSSELPTPKPMHVFESLSTMKDNGEGREEWGDMWTAHRYSGVDTGKNLLLC